MLKYLFPLLLVASPLQAQSPIPPPPAVPGVMMASLKCPQMPVRFPNAEVAVAFVRWSYELISDEDLYDVVAKTPGLSVDAARQWVTMCKGTPS